MKALCGFMLSINARETCNTNTWLSFTFLIPWFMSSVNSFHTDMPSLRFRSELTRILLANTSLSVAISSSTLANSWLHSAFCCSTSSGVRPASSGTTSSLGEMGTPSSPEIWKKKHFFIKTFDISSDDKYQRSSILSYYINFDWLRIQNDYFDDFVYLSAMKKQPGQIKF